MRGWIVIPALAVALGVVPASGQRGAGHPSGGHGGFASRGGGSHFGGMRPGSGPSSRGFAPSRPHQSYSRQPSFGGLRGFNGPRFRNRGFGNCFGCRRRGYGYPFGYAGFYDPYWWWDSGSSYDDDRAREIDMANQMNRESLEEQSAREQGDQDLYARFAPRQSQDAAPAQTDPGPATVLVFRDQHKQEIRNYAIVGQTLWNFASPRTLRIPLADLDLEATAQANEDRGLNFHLPVFPAGQ
jgi:hypothetical protein